MRLVSCQAFPLVAEAQVTISFDQLPADVAVTTQFPEAIFSSHPGFENRTRQPIMPVGSSLPNIICTAEVGRPIACVFATFIDFPAPISDLTFSAVGVNNTGVVAEINVYETGALSSVVPIVGQGDTFTPVPVDLSQFHDITRIELVHITDGAGIGWDDFHFILSNKLCFYADKGLPGHGFVQFLPLQGPQAGRRDLVNGKYPDTWNLFTGEGVVKNDRRRPWNQRICYAVTTAEYNAAAEKVNSKQTSGTNYRLVETPPGNCMNWMVDVAGAASLTVPNVVAFLGIATPGAFSRSLEALGDGGVFHGGRVEFNQQPGIGPDGEPVATEIPDDWDTEQLALASHDDPVSLADYLNLAANVTDLGDFETATLLSVQVSGLVSGEMLISVDWGDGTSLEGQESSYVHSYEAGQYTASLAVINSGALEFYSWDVVVSGVSTYIASEQGASIEIILPVPIPAGGSNPGFEDVVTIALLPTATLFSDGFESGDTSSWSATQGARGVDGLESEW